MLFHPLDMAIPPQSCVCTFLKLSLVTLLFFLNLTFKFVCLVHTWLLCCQVARAVCSVFRLFGALSAHLRDIDSEDKAGVVRREEWSDVFVLSTHTAMSRTWRIIAGRLSYVSLCCYFKIDSFKWIGSMIRIRIFCLSISIDKLLQVKQFDWFEKLVSNSFSYWYSQWIRESWINRNFAANFWDYCEIPRDMGARIRKERGRDNIVLC